MTKAQRLAADPSHSVWLAAHAGTGKTKVLIDRVMRILLRGDAPSSILCITFTKAAAAEMQDRLRQKMSEWAVCSDEMLHEELKDLYGRDALADEKHKARQLLCELLDDPYGVRIQTIHAFCQSLLAKFPIEAGVQPHADLMDDRSQAELLQEAKEKLIEQLGDHAVDETLKRAFLTLATGLSDQWLSKLLDEICKSHKVLSQLFAHSDAIDVAHAQVRDVFQVNEGDTIERLAQDYIVFTDKEQLKQLVSTLSGKYGNIVKEAIANWLEKDCLSDELISYASSWMSSSSGKPYGLNSIALKTFRENHPELTEFVQQELERNDRFIQSVNAIKIVEFSHAVTKVAQGLLSIFEQLKRQRGAMGYDDLIMYAQYLLQQDGISSWVLEKLDQKLTHFLIDEAQDTAPEQWTLVYALVKELFDKIIDESSRRSLFVVGDEKQSIYRFQGADPKGFALWREAYRHFHTQHDKSLEICALDRSFRSSAAILDVVDRVANACGFVSQDGGPIVHDVHHKGRAGCVTVHPVIKQGAIKIPPFIELEAPLHASKHVAAILAEQIAAEIKQWLEHGRELPSKGRAVKASDILILVQKRQPLAGLLISALRKQNVPVAGGDRLKLNEHIAANDVLAIAEWALMAEDSLKLATILKGPWFGLSEDALYELAAHRGDVSLWHSIQHSEPELAARLNDMKTRCLADSPFGWLDWMLHHQQGVRLAKQYLGDEVEDLFDELLTQARLYEESHPPSMSLFIKWLRANDQEIKRELEQSANMVRVMTVHGAKGLQAPIVVLPDTTRTVQAGRQLVWWHKDENGVAYPIVTPVGIKSDAFSAIKDADKLAQEEESLRLLYVALTRAESELHIYGYLKGENVSDDCWHSRIASVLDGHDACETDEDGVMRLSHPQTADIKPDKDDQPKPISEKPQWFDVEAPIWSAVKMVSPSQIGADEYDGRGAASEPSDDNALATARGNLTHRLLQWLPTSDHDIKPEDLMFLAKLWAEGPAANQLDMIVNEVLATWQSPQCGALFSEHAHSEVSLVGQYTAANGTHYHISGQIDKLVVESDRIIVADFKSNRGVPESPDLVDGKYLRQLAMYQLLLKPLYPHHAFESVLVWTKNAQWMAIGQSAIDETLEGLDSFLEQT